MLTNARRVALALVTICAIFGLHVGSATAQVTITVDENGNSSFGGSPLPFTVGPDGGPGGSPTALTYQLPFLGTAGDLVVNEPPLNESRSELIRFDGNGHLFFYSDVTPSDGVNALADIGVPESFQSNAVLTSEVGTEGNNSITYTPTSGQPGFFTGTAITYVIISDAAAAIPEPSSLALLATGLGLLALRRRRPEARGQALRKRFQ